MGEHGSSLRIYFLVFAALMVGTALTVAVAFVDMGAFNDIVALTIAVIKATLVVLFFMHVYHSKLMVKLTLVASFFWLAILVALTMSDYVTREFLK